MWFLNLPTGLILIALSPLIPESARFLQHMGRGAEARAMLARFGAVVRSRDRARRMPRPSRPTTRPCRRRFAGYLGTTIALTLAALAWGFVNFGLLLWLPSQLVAEGRSVGLAATIIARSTFIAAPAVAVAAWLYSAWSTKWSLLAMVGADDARPGCGAARRDGHPAAPLQPDRAGGAPHRRLDRRDLDPAALCGGELSPQVRGRATGWVAGCSKVGGLIAQALSALALVPALGLAALAVALPAALSLALIAALGRETRNRDLRELEVSSASLYRPPLSDE